MSQASAPSQAPSSNNLFEMKAGSFTLPSLLLRSIDADALDAYLAEQVARLPQFFDQAPLVLDLSQYPDSDLLASFPAIVGLIRGHGMVPVGVRGATPEQADQARLLELAIMPQGREQALQSQAATPAAPAIRDSLLVEGVVRSGQRIYAEGTDLILLGGVSSGAEVMADGHIHAYGAIRGRVLAGVRDNTRAHIFCHDMGAELVAIAGRYMVAEDLPRRHLGRSVRISLQDNSLNFTAL